MANNPYLHFSDEAFWSRSVAKNYNPKKLLSPDKPLIAKSDRIVSAGSCFASNIIPYLEANGYNYIRNEKIAEGLDRFADNLGYDAFNARYGYIYTARHLLQLLLRAKNEFIPIHNYWEIDGKYIDPFRPGLKYPPDSLDEFHYLTKSHLEAVMKTFQEANCFVFTLGLTECWENKQDGAVYPACPGTVSGNWDESVYSFKNLTVNEVVQDFIEFAIRLREINPSVRFILTVSPVPLVATASEKHVLQANTYSKSVLRVAAEEIVTQLNDSVYFPAFEIITGTPTISNFFARDLRSVTKNGLDTVMNVLFGESDVVSSEKSPSVDTSASSFRKVSNQIVQKQCDEEFQDRSR